MGAGGPCDALGAVGEWQFVSPPDFVDPPSCGGGTLAFVVDPLNPGTVYLGTCQGGIYKSTQCGARDSWVLINQGTETPTCWGAQKSCAVALSEGRQWNLEIDPVDSRILYTANGFGGDVPWGLFKSTDGAVNWSIIWPVAETDPRWDESFEGVPSFVGGVTIDPADHQHLLLSFHAPCEGSHISLCVAESMDSGVHWRIAEGDARMQGYSPHDTALYLVDSNIWIQSTQGGDAWRTSDRGASWDPVELNPGDTVLGGMFRRRDGSLLWGGVYHLFSGSSLGLDWQGSEARGVRYMTYAGDRIVRSATAVCHQDEFPNGNADPYRISRDEGLTWEALPSPAALHQGGFVAYDTTHHVLYSSNCQDGFWRVRLQ
jgi:hypothetical protein